jgi:hypothetical protein
VVDGQRAIVISVVSDEHTFSVIFAAAQTGTTLAQQVQLHLILLGCLPLQNAHQISVHKQ